MSDRKWLFNGRTIFNSYKAQLSGLDFTTVFCCNNLNLHRKTSCKDLSFMGIYVLLPNKTNPKRKAFYEQ